MKIRYYEHIDGIIILFENELKIQTNIVEELTEKMSNLVDLSTTLNTFTCKIKQKFGEFYFSIY